MDNGSDDGTAAVLAEHPARPEVLRLRENLGYAGGLAAALPHVRTPYVAWLNDDAAPEPGWLGALEDALDDERVAAASAVLITAAGEVQSTGVRLTADGHGADALGMEVFGFCGGAALLRVDDLRRAGGIPADFFCYYEDTDTAWRLRLLGRDVVTVAAARATHVHGASTLPGSAAFHRWNERNRLLTLVRCAPRAVAAREFVRFAAITLMLPLRRVLRHRVPHAANFRFAVRLRVIAEVATRLAPALRARWQIGRAAVVHRRAVWQRWHGR